MLSPELLLIFTINKIDITKERINKYIFSFLDKKAIQDILIELKIIRSTATIKNVLLRKETLSPLKKLFENAASMKNMSIVLK
jgi:hypothetical protein